MATKPLDQTVPKAVLQARGKLEAAGLEFTPESLATALSSSDISSLQAAIRYNINKSGSEKEKHGYAQIDDEATRLKLMSAFVVDPDVSKCFAFHTTSRSTAAGVQGRRLWLTLEQLASPIIFNSMRHAELVAAAAEAAGDSRPSKYAALAAAGVK